MTLTRLFRLFLCFSLAVVFISGCHPDEKTIIVKTDVGQVEAIVKGHGPAVVMLPSLVRAATDFDELADRLADEHYKAVAVNLRGIGNSQGPLEEITQHDLAADVAALIKKITHGSHQSVHIVGHAYGNRIARTVANDYPELVKSVTLVAAGGLVPMADDVYQDLVCSIDFTKTDEERLGCIQRAFFAEGNDASVWLDGWYPDIATSQSAATQATNIDDWWVVEDRPILIVQGLEDVIAVPENGHLLAEEVGTDVTVVDLENAGHALLPEVPDQIANAMVEFLNKVEGRCKCK